MSIMSVIIATSNICSDLIQRNLEAGEDDRKSDQQLKKRVRRMAEAQGRLIPPGTAASGAAHPAPRPARPGSRR